MRESRRRSGDIAAVKHGVSLADFLAPFAGEREIRFERLPFDHPLYIMYSSGTTGVPKCIVHCAGGALLQHLKEHQLQGDVQADDRLFYFTTCGWMMWNWLVSGLASGATLLLYDGSPFVGRGNILFDYADAEGMTHFGTSAKFIDAIAKIDLQPRQTHKLEHVRTMFSTGSPLVAEGFDYVYANIKPDIQLASISGGTDIISCFVIGNPNGPVYRGEIQCAGLGMAVDVFDDEGQPVRGEKGELVCTRSFPVMPIGFWNDADGAKYHAAYFERFDNIWCHGDFAEITAHGGFIIYGRSDATLNPGGVRIGTAEIYRAGRKARRGRRIHRHRPGLAAGQQRRCARGALRQAARGPGARRGAGKAHQAGDQGQHHAAPRAGEDPAGRRHPAHQERQDRRTRRAQRGARQAGEERRGAGQSGSAGALPRSR